MRRDVKRSLVLWPAAVSGTITAAAWFSLASIDLSAFVALAARTAINVAPSLSVSATHASACEPTGLTASLQRPVVDEQPIRKRDENWTPVAIPRAEFGSRPMELPPRIARVYGVGTRMVKAPRVDVRAEVAGLVEIAEEVEDTLPIDPIDTEFPRSVQSTLEDRIPSSPSDLRREDLYPSIPKSDGYDAARASESPQGSSPESADNRQPDVELTPRGKPESRSPRLDRSLIAWPIASELEEQLQALRVERAETASSNWSSEVLAALQDLGEIPRLSDPSAGPVLQELSRLAEKGFQSAERNEDRQRQIQWLVACHAINRRLAVWRSVWELAATSQTQAPQAYMVGDLPAIESDHRIDDSAEANRQRTTSLRDAIQKVREDLADTGDPKGWDDFLLLTELEAAIDARHDSAQVILAQRVLSRLEHDLLDESQSEVVSRHSIEAFAEAVRPWAQTAVDYARLLRQLERQESDAIDLVAIDIANSVQTLRFADYPAAAEIGQTIETHYRNANLRVAFAQEMIERFLPQVEEQTVPVRTRAFGSRVRGVSRVGSELEIALNPARGQWSLDLVAAGNVHTHSIGSKGSVKVRTAARSNYQASIPIRIDRRGLDIGESKASVDGQTWLRGVETEYDGFPLIGPLVRSIAERQYQELKPRSTRIANRTVQQRVSNEIEVKTKQRADAATERLSKAVLGPLAELQLNPSVIDLQTTDQRLLARYRVAGDWQLGAFTPRPRAPASSLMSLQIHQSAINNTVERLITYDRPLSIHHAVERIAETFGQDADEIPNDIPNDVTVQFAKTRPITVEVEEGELWITLRILRLQNDDALHLTRFIVRAKYVPQADGIQAQLVRDGHLRISGPRLSMRERLPIRAIFNKVLSSNRPFALTLPAVANHEAMEGLAISQFELRDGWIGLAISHEDAPRIALQ